eukprot:GSA25T00010265001.1
MEQGEKKRSVWKVAIGSACIPLEDHEQSSETPQDDPPGPLATNVVELSSLLRQEVKPPLVHDDSQPQIFEDTSRRPDIYASIGRSASGSPVCNYCELIQFQNRGDSRTFLPATAKRGVSQHPDTSSRGTSCASVVPLLSASTPWLDGNSPSRHAGFEGGLGVGDLRSLTTRSM